MCIYYNVENNDKLFFILTKCQKSGILYVHLMKKHENCKKKLIFC